MPVTAKLVPILQSSLNVKEDHYLCDELQHPKRCTYSGDFLKVYHFRRCLALYVRDPRVGNYRVSTCVASRVSRRYHYKPIKSYYQPVYDSPIRDVCAGSQTPIILPVYTCEANAGTRRKAFIQSNPLKWHCSNRVGI